MLKYKLKSNPIKLGSKDYIRDYLLSLGINNPENFINEPKEENEEYFGNLDNIFDVIKILYDGFKNNKIFFLQVDSDVDGFTSSAIFYSFFKRLFPESIINYRLHDGKEHGIFVDTVPLETDIVIIPDAGSMQLDEQEQLSNNGKIVIIIDHHNVTEKQNFKNVYLVNNQTSEKFKNKSLSGAGVVYKVIQAFNIFYRNEFPIIYSDYNDLAAVGIVSDMMDTRNDDNNFLIFHGLKNIKNPMLKALLKKQDRGDFGGVSDANNPNKIDIAFYIAPIINGVIRAGELEDKEALFKGMLDYNNGEVIISYYRSEERRESIYEYLARTSMNIRNKQNKEKTKCMEFLSAKIEENKLQENQLLLVTISKDDEVVVPQTITGLVAMELLKKYKKPTLVLRPKIENNKLFYAGSGRGKQNGDFDSLFDFLKDSGYCSFVEGHDMAFGTSIEEENIPKLIEYANKKLKELNFDVEETEVDFIFNKNNLDPQLIMSFGNSMRLYGNGIPQPKFAFEFELPSSSIRIQGANLNTIKFSVGGIDFIRFRDSELANQISEGGKFKIKLIGRAQVNSYMGHYSPQIIIDEIDVEKQKIEVLRDLF